MVHPKRKFGNEVYARQTMTHIGRVVTLFCALLLISACGGTTSSETAVVETAPNAGPTQSGPTGTPTSDATISAASAADIKTNVPSPTPVPKATYRPTGEGSPAPATVATEARTPAPSGRGDGIVPIGEDQARQELRKAGVLTTGWKTNFTLRSIDYGDIFSGGPGKDGIPAIDAPKFGTVAEADEWLDDREPVQVINLNGHARAYPMQIMMWHEIVNDTVGGEPVVITY